MTAITTAQLATICEAVLAAKIEPRSKQTVRDYLHELLTRLWNLGDGFSGKRPFGNSGWEFDLYAALVRAKLVAGELDEDGYIISFDQAKADQLIFDAIDHVFRAPAGE